MRTMTEHGREREHDEEDVTGTITTEERDDATDEVSRLRAQVVEYEDRWKRAAAEFQNYRRRTESERTEAIRGANSSLLREVLPVLDDLERALANVPPEQAESKWVEGAQLVERKFRAIMERQGLTPIESVGQPFDPALHEAIGGSGTHVEQEFQRGYRLNGRTLRPAMVIVGAAPTTEGDDPEA